MKKKKTIQLKFEVKNWSDIKDKYFEILIPDLDNAIRWMSKIGIKIIKKNNQYWMVFNEDKKNAKI